MNPEKVIEEKDHHIFGHAFHCRLLEGASVFAMRYCMEISKSDYSIVLESTDEIKDYISKQTWELPIAATDDTPATTRTMHHKPVSRVEEDDGNGGVRKRAAKKDDWIAQLLEIDPNAPLWSNLVEEYRAENDGKTMLTASQIKELEISARMIERDEGIRKLAHGGYSEVSLFWHCPETGLPMKARVDKLKVKRMVDLKTIAENGRSMENSIRQTIANYKYTIQPAVYIEGGAEVRKIVRENGAAAIHVWPDKDGVIDAAREKEVTEYALKWASHLLPDEWTWIFQQKGPAPITRALHYQAQSTMMMSNDIVSLMKKRFIEYAGAFGIDPWLDIAAPYDVYDEDLLTYTTEI